jgi:hypothetical protein
MLGDSLRGVRETGSAPYSPASRHPLPVGLSVTTWRCRKCKTFHYSKRFKRCDSCGTLRAVRKSKHARLLDAARPQYEALLEAQGGRCAVCLCEPSSRRRFDIDHDHGSLRVRGLLCVRCNRALPYWVTAEWLRAAADYLEKASSPLVGGPETV